MGIGIKVDVNRAQLLATLRLNRETHRREYDEAYREWRRLTVIGLEQLLDDFKSGQSSNTYYRSEHPKPVAYLDEYDAVIGMLALSSEETIRLDYEDYGRFYLDRWDWSESFRASHSYYTKQ